MPRGRAGLDLIPADQVRAVVDHRNPDLVAEFFGVSTRTVRRWRRNGLPLRYGRANIEPRRWQYFAQMHADEWERAARKLWLVMERSKSSASLARGQVSRS